MANIGNFDASKVEPSQSFEPLPPGWYAMQAIDSEVKDTKKGDGKYLQITFEILESQHPELKGRLVWERLNLWNSNAQAVEISQRSLSALCRAVGVMAIGDSEELHGKPVAVKLKVRQSGDYEPTNDVSGYDAIGARFGAGSPAPAAQAAKPAATPPWKK